MSIKEQKIIHRNIVETFIGFFHVLFGFFSTIWAVIRISVIGYASVFESGILIGIFNYLYEFKSLLLWISGVGILRAQAWGRKSACVWAWMTIIFTVASRIIRKHYMGILANDFEWGEILILYYSIALIVYLQK